LSISEGDLFRDVAGRQRSYSVLQYAEAMPERRRRLRVSASPTDASRKSRAAALRSLESAPRPWQGSSRSDNFPLILHRLATAHCRRFVEGVYGPRGTALASGNHRASEAKARAPPGARPLRGLRVSPAVRGGGKRLL